MLLAAGLQPLEALLQCWQVRSWAVSAKLLVPHLGAAALQVLNMLLRHMSSCNADAFQEALGCRLLLSRIQQD